MAGPQGTPALVFDGVELARSAHALLTGVSFTIERGSSWALVGRNGSGKSTLLLAALGVLRPRCGRIERAAELRDRTGLGFVPQRLTQEASLPTTVREFVEIGLLGLAVPRRQRRARVASALSIVGLDGHARHSLWAHSEGQRQRILLARALARQPRILLMDEPTASLDPVASGKFWDLVVALRQQRELTILCATHDLAAVARVADRALLCAPPRVEVHRSADVGSVLGVPEQGVAP